MRLEATVPDGRGEAAGKLADELGLSRSQLIDEALSLFLKAVVEVRRGRRLVTMDPSSSSPACELVTPTLSAMRTHLATSKAPSSRLRAAAKRHKR